MPIVAQALANPRPAQKWCTCGKSLRPTSRVRIRVPYQKSAHIFGRYIYLACRGVRGPATRPPPHSRIRFRELVQRTIAVSVAIWPMPRRAKFAIFNADDGGSDRRLIKAGKDACPMKEVVRTGCRLGRPLSTARLLWMRRFSFASVSTREFTFRWLAFWQFQKALLW